MAYGFDAEPDAGPNAEERGWPQVPMRTSVARSSSSVSFALAAIAMLCSKCHQNEATVHFTTVVDGTEEETVHLCKECAPPTGFDLDKLDLKQIEALSVVGKKCEFCGKAAFSGEMRARGGAIYWCFDCGLEFGSIFQQFLVTERPDLLQRRKEESSFLSFYSDPGLQAWSAAASERAVQALKERRRKDGRDKGS